MGRGSRYFLNHEWHINGCLFKQTFMGIKTFTVADYLLARLKELGVDHLFGVVGDFSLGFFRRVYQSPVKMICTCNELNAAYAADGYARVRGLGGIVTTYVVGELSAINGVAGAFAENIPVIKITGCPPRNHFRNRTPLHHTLGDYEIPLRLYREITAFAEILHEPSLAPSTIDFAIQSCISERKPVYLGIPADIVMTPCKKPSSKLIIPQKYSAFLQNLKPAVDAAAALLNKAKKPLILVDFEIPRFSLQKAVGELIKKTGYPFGTFMLSKSVFDENHPQYIGTYSGSNSKPIVKNQVEESDGVLILGLKLTDFNSGGFSLKFKEGKTVNATMESIVIGDQTFNGVDLLEFINALNGKLKKRSIGSLEFEAAKDFPEYKRALAYKPEKGKKLTLSRFFDRMASYLGPDTILITETGSSLFAGAEMILPKGAKFMSQTFFGSIGSTVGSTLGVAVGSPNKRVILSVGDGSFQLTCQEISTMIRNNLNPIIFLINNDGYLVERTIGDGPFNDIQPWHYSKLPEAFGGGWGCKVKTEEELEEALMKAWNNKSLSLIELVIGKWDAPQSMKKVGAATAKTDWIAD